MRAATLTIGVVPTAVALVGAPAAAVAGPTDDSEAATGPRSGPGAVPAGSGRTAEGRAERFAARLAAAYRDRSGSLVGYAQRKVGDRGRAEDVVQRAFEKVLRGQRRQRREITNLDAYLMSAVCNEVNRELREVISIRARQVDGGGCEPPHGLPEVVDVPAQVAMRITLRDELARLAPREREAVVMRIQLQLSVAEAAEIMRLSAGAVKRYTHDGLRHLRERMAV